MTPEPEVALVEHGSGPARAVTVELGFMQASGETPIANVILNAPDETTFGYVTNLLLQGHSGSRTFESSSPVTFFGDQSITVSFYVSNMQEEVICEVACRNDRRALTHDFVFRSAVGPTEYSIFKNLLAATEFYYIVPGLRGEADFAHIVLPKYIVKTHQL